MKINLLKYFPVPEYIRPEKMGISFSDSNIKGVFFDQISKKPTPKNLIVSLPKGAIVDGKIEKKENVVEALTVLKEEFKMNFVFFTIPDELAYIFSTKVSVPEKGGANDNVAFTLEENVPLSLADSIFDFVPTKSFKEKDGKNLSASVVVVASDKKEISKYVEAIERAQMVPLGCINESQAIANSVLPKKTKGVFCIVHARENRIGIYLVKDRVVVFSSISSVVIGEKSYGNKFLEEYEKFLEYSIKYAVGKEDPIISILVCGEFESSKKVVESVMSSNLDNKNIKLSNVWSNVLKIEENLPEISYEDSLNIAGPIGAVLSEII